MRTRSSGCFLNSLLISNAHNTGASTLVRKTSAPPSPVGHAAVCLPLLRCGTARCRARSLATFHLLALLVDEQFRITHDVDEQDVRNLQTQLRLFQPPRTNLTLLNRSARASENPQMPNSAADRTWDRAGVGQACQRQKFVRKRDPLYCLLRRARRRFFRSADRRGAGPRRAATLMRRRSQPWYPPGDWALAARYCKAMSFSPAQAAIIAK